MVRGVQRQVKRRKLTKAEKELFVEYERQRQWYGIRESIKRAAATCKLPRAAACEALGFEAKYGEDAA